MSRREENDSIRPSAQSPQHSGADALSQPPNAFARELFDELRKREHHPATPEPDLAYLGAAGLALAERRARFRFQRGADDRLHLMHDGYPVATVAPSVPEGCSLPTDLTRLVDLRAQPQPLAHFLLAVPEKVLEKAGAIVMELLRGERR